jgi:hypothetical protein
LNTVVRYVNREVDRMKADSTEAGTSQSLKEKVDKVKTAPFGLLQHVIRTANKSKLGLVRLVQ